MQPWLPVGAPSVLQSCATAACCRHQLYDAQTTYDILRLWDLYGLDWPYGSKVGQFLLKQREPKATEVIQVNGSRHRSAVDFRAEWQSEEKISELWSPKSKRTKS
ncbi:unnamed protein product [Effrenium voratum]|uniref:Uncharacterized protein n=1 Tax=Effrenium voratum TaxID=2562239 RepID=A0AA36MP72_9DINO|nr:unnamed protein product [Effrenium voratum]